MNRLPPQIFDRHRYARQRARSSVTEFLVADAAQNIAERIAACREAFSSALDLSSREASFTKVRSAADRWIRSIPAFALPGSVVADEEALPFAPESFDLIASVLSLHAVNDLPGALIQIQRALKPGGLFIAALFGGETLRELRESLAAAESEVTGGVTPRISPFADVRDLGALLQRAGFAGPVSDTERTIARYNDVFALAADLRALGETNVLRQRSKKFMRRDMLEAVLVHYQRHHADTDGRLRATFDIIYLTGWSPRQRIGT